MRTKEGGHRKEDTRRKTKEGAQKKEGKKLKTNGRRNTE